MNTTHWESLFETKLKESGLGDDPAHDLLHFKRVIHWSKKLAALENGKIEVILPAAWFHDLVNVPKNDPRRSQASKLSADVALRYLESVHYPSTYFEEIRHAIEAHSFSANIHPRTLEAQIVQDADRLDGLGAIGIARCFATAGLLKRPLYSEHDPFCQARPPQDLQFTIDHFYQKLFKVAETMQTASGKAEAKRRIQIMKQYLDAFSIEIDSD